MKILIADDHLVVRKGLIQIIEDEFTAVQIEEVGSGLEALDRLRNHVFDIAILDITMPGMNGLEVVKQAIVEALKTPLLVLTSLPEEQYALRVLKAGASGFIGKERAGEELTQAIRKILSGRKYITGSLSEQMSANVASDPVKTPQEALSPREREIMLLLASGKTVSQIAEELSIAMTTVSTFRNRVFEKMNFNNNSDLMRYVLSLPRA